MDENRNAGEVDIDTMVSVHENESEGGRIPLSLSVLMYAATLMYVLGAVVLALVPFFDWATLFNAVCFFVIGYCVVAFYRMMVADDTKTGRARHIIWCRLLREIRDAIRDNSIR